MILLCMFLTSIDCDKLMMRNSINKQITGSQYVFANTLFRCMSTEKGKESIHHIYKQLVVVY